MLREAKESAKAKVTMDGKSFGKAIVCYIPQTLNPKPKVLWG